MNKAVILGLLVVASPAFAGGKEGSIGVGIEYGLENSFAGVGAGVGGVSINYDAGIFHAGGMIGYSRVGEGDAAKTDFNIGARFYYHVHSTGMSDFGVGGEIGIDEVPVANGHDSVLFINPGFQIRAFITPNVALSFTGGLVVATADGHGIALTGGVNGLAGVHYYF